VKTSRAIGKVLATVAALPLSGCGLAHSPVVDPHGTIALIERNLLFTAAGLMLIVVVPVWVLTFLFAWHYRASNRRARYMPDWSYSAGLDAIIWLVPTLIVGSLGYLVWDYTHQLDPYKAIAAPSAPLEVDVVAEDWKWLFIYPEQNIATVNELVFPSERPLALKLTADTVMNSFYVPGLVGQIFVMAGMSTLLNLRADGPSEFLGRNMQYSGVGFPEQIFSVRATTASDFDAWVAAAKRSPDAMGSATLAKLEAPSSGVPVHYYSSVDPDLFARIITKYAGPPMRHAHTSASPEPVQSEGH
jgi:cytochrome o ubiquinol oxidase subunit II